MRQYFYLPFLLGLILISPELVAQDPLSDCEIYFDELELKFKKDQKDTKKYFHIQLEEGNAIFKKDLDASRSFKERKELRREYKTFVKDLERDYNDEMDRIEDEYVQALQESSDDCGYAAVRYRIRKLNMENSYAAREDDY